MSISSTRTSTRGPSVLVTDTRERAPRPPVHRTGTRIISVDNVLQYASEIPSAQRRHPPGTRPLHARTPIDPKLSGKGIPLSGAHIPARSSKTSEKLVLLPETTEEEEDEFSDDDAGPPRDEELQRRRLARGGKSEAERLPKSQRIADPHLARVTAYCTAQSYKMRSTATFVRDQHGAKTKLYDDCLYGVYQLPLQGGTDGYRVKSSPVVRHPGGRSVLDEQIEANERRQYREGWGEESEEYSVRGNASPYQADTPLVQELVLNGEREEDTWEAFRRESDSSGYSIHGSTVAEVFIFSYGVVVLWNFTANQEKDILADLTFSNASATGMAPPLMTRPLEESDFETEEFHFQYDRDAEKPRIYNDMITLRTRDHMVKLAMSHAIGQSTKLSFFEERMQKTMESAQYVPRRLALEGRLGMDRKEIVSLVGRLFEGRVDVNLSSNMLDTPNFFWDAEPTLHPLYAAVREYLEIKPRVQILNERCRVFLDLAEILSDSVADVKMTRITWIIIVLIVLSIMVTCLEVIIRFALLASSGKNKEGGDMGAMCLSLGYSKVGEL